MASPILVTGGTGTLGTHVVPLLREAGREVRVLSRRGGAAADGVSHVAADLLSGTGLAPALDGVETVLHLAGGPKGDDTATEHLVRAARQAGVRHLVLISVIGADTVPIGYFRAKHGAEQAVAGSGLGWTTLRAAQFHDLALKTVRALAKLPLVPAPATVRWQPVDSRDVAELLAELTLGQPAMGAPPAGGWGRVADLAGPEVLGLDQLVRDYLAAAGRRRPLLPLRVPGKVGKAYRAGANLNLEARTGKRTWADFLAQQVR